MPTKEHMEYNIPKKTQGSKVPVKSPLLCVFQQRHSYHRYHDHYLESHHHSLLDCLVLLLIFLSQTTLQSSQKMKRFSQGENFCGDLSFVVVVIYLYENAVIWLLEL